MATAKTCTKRVPGKEKVKKIWTIFAIYILLDELLYIFGRWWSGLLCYDIYIYLV
jgi:hypothetical protein